MRLFCFASKNMENIRRGYEAGRWAVATVSDVQNKGRRTKAQRYMRRGDVGIIYCSPRESFTLPFVVDSEVELDTVVTDIWPEPWVLPFDIRPLGPPERQISKDRAAVEWTAAQRLAKTPFNVLTSLNGTGTCVFVPSEVTDEEWREMTWRLVH